MSKSSERNLIQERIIECEARMRGQREIIAQMLAVGGDTALADNLLSAMENSQALRFRRLANLAL